MHIATLFSGIGAPEQGASRVYGSVHTVFACEWDKFARESYLANYSIDPSHFHKDVNDLDATIYKGKVDVLVGGSPCQAFSIAGMRKGTADERGQLIYQYIRVVEECKPPVIIYENVKGMLNIGNGSTIKEFIQALRDIGYHCHYGIVNTKHYGIPQNRERLYVVGFLDVETYHNFTFAPAVPLETRLKDILEQNVPSKYYLTQKALKGFQSHGAKHLERGNGFKFQPTNGVGCAMCISTKAGSRPTDNFLLRAIPNAKALTNINPSGNGISISEPCIAASRGRNIDNPSDRTPGEAVEQRLEVNSQGTSNTITTVQKDNYVMVPSANKRGWEKATHQDCINLSVPNSKTRRGRVGKQVSQTLDTACNQGVLFLYNTWWWVRKLTPRECLRLQDFPDSFKIVVSDSQAYKQAGNSMSVNILEMIFTQIEKAKAGEVPVGKLF